MYKFRSLFVHDWSCTLLDILFDQEKDTRDIGLKQAMKSWSSRQEGKYGISFLNPKHNCCGKNHNIFNANITTYAIRMLCKSQITRTFVHNWKQQSSIENKLYITLFCSNRNRSPQIWFGVFLSLRISQWQGWWMQSRKCWSGQPGEWSAMQVHPPKTFWRSWLVIFLIDCTTDSCCRLPTDEWLYHFE